MPVHLLKQDNQESVFRNQAVTVRDDKLSNHIQQIRCPVFRGQRYKFSRKFSLVLFPVLPFRRWKAVKDESAQAKAKREFEQDLIQGHVQIHRAVLSWTHNQADADDIVQEAEYRSLNYMEERQWLPVIKNTQAFVIRIAVNLRNDKWSNRRKEGLEYFDADSGGQQDESLVNEASKCNQSATDIETRIYLKELSQTVPWHIILQGLSEYESRILIMNAVDSMSNAAIAEEENRNVETVRYHLQKIYGKIVYRARRYLEETGRKSLFDREA
jgi:DNA-directed RNA polymerase specialized sigma24 family protein